MRDVDVDPRRGCMWLATWSGVLCWRPDDHLCVRYTSARGLLGNATHGVAVDKNGLAWAGAHERGLCRLSPNDGTPWQPQPRLATYAVLRLAPRPGGSVYAVLCNASRASTLGEIAAPHYHPILHRGGMATHTSTRCR